VYIRIKKLEQLTEPTLTFNSYSSAGSEIGGLQSVYGWGPMNWARVSWARTTGREGPLGTGINSALM